MKRFIALLISFFWLAVAHAQFAPQAGVSGSTAISADSSVFVAWATACQVQRGYRDIAVPDSGYASAGIESNATGPVDHAVISLGDSGVAVLTFAMPVYNGPGPDFAVFENGFANPLDPEEAFLEFAFVEVSSDGINYFRFPAASYIPDTAQVPIAGVYTNARQVNNLAGKYISGFGTPFDLEDLTGTPGLDLNHITHVRLVDVIGSVEAHASLDTGGRKINDPYPTNIPTSGFDLDAVGVIHQMAAASVSEAGARPRLQVYPNPATDRLFISTTAGGLHYTLTDITGKLLMSGGPDTREAINISGLSSGLYCIILQDSEGNKWFEKITKR
jgi:hypothetical protein